MDPIVDTSLGFFFFPTLFNFVFPHLLFALNQYGLKLTLVYIFFF